MSKNTSPRSTRVIVTFAPTSGCTTRAAQARFIRTKWDLGLAGGVVLSTPVPQAAAMTFEEIAALTRQALAEAKAQGITGKAVTPFLLARIKVLTGGRSLVTNIALVKHNAEVGARLALALAQAGRGAGAV